jgi:hypothetical protein
MTSISYTEAIEGAGQWVFDGSLTGVAKFYQYIAETVYPTQIVKDSFPVGILSGLAENTEWTRGWMLFGLVWMAGALDVGKYTKIESIIHLGIRLGEIYGGGTEPDIPMPPTFLFSLNETEVVWEWVDAIMSHDHSCVVVLADGDDFVVLVWDGNFNEWDEDSFVIHGGNIKPMSHFIDFLTEDRYFYVNGLTAPAHTAHESVSIDPAIWQDRAKCKIDLQSDRVALTDVQFSTYNGDCFEDAGHSEFIFPQCVLLSVNAPNSQWQTY